MKKMIIAALALGFAFASATSMAMNHEKMDHGDMKSMDHGDMKGMDHGNMMGEMIHQSEVDSHKMMYQLIDNKAQMEKMKDMKGMKMEMGADQMKSNHLMMYVKDKDGKAVSGAKVGYQVTGPDGAKQQVMAMEMGDGYGADVDMAAAGTYKVQVKVMAGDSKLIDSFDYEKK